MRLSAYQRSSSLVNLAPALAKAMGAMDLASKDSENPHFKSRYADLASCHSAAIGPLSANGLSFPMFPLVEPTDAGGAIVTMVALLLHASGEFLEGSITVPCGKADAHGIGSAETYARRYLYSMVGIVAGDDDGNGATQGKQPPVPQRTAQPPAPPKVAPKPVKAAEARVPVSEGPGGRYASPPAQRQSDPPPAEPAVDNLEAPITDAVRVRVKAAVKAAGLQGQPLLDLIAETCDGKTPEQMNNRDALALLAAIEALKS